jgi:uroporphyrinogen decarboxylase
VHETLGFFDAIKLTKEMLDDEVPLIFAGSPWTIMCYAVEGQGSKSFDKARILLAIQKRLTFYCKNYRYTILYLQEKSRLMQFRF